MAALNKLVRAAVIVDNCSLKQWQLDAIKHAEGVIHVCLFLSCENSPRRSVSLRNVGYYSFAYVLGDRGLSGRKPIETDNAEVVSFTSEYQGGWQVMPDHVLELIQATEVDVIVKFGMGLLRIPERLRGIPILSYHHGDPTKYRGRPAIFYEMLNTETTVGVIVQQLSNKLDGGLILADAEVAVRHYSYRETQKRLYSISRFLLRDALLQTQRESLDRSAGLGPLRSIPNNGLVLKLIFKIFYTALTRLFELIFRSKFWRIHFQENLDIDAGADVVVRECGSILPASPKYSFVADPFWISGSEFIYEAMPFWSIDGVIATSSLNNAQESRVLIEGGHYSYPMTFSHDEKVLLIPEMSHAARQLVYDISGADAEPIFELNELSGLAVKDPTYYAKDGTDYLFFSEGTEGNEVLQLWISPSGLFKFEPHPCSPICLTPEGARMGGKIYEADGELVRFGQCCAVDYGNGLIVFKIVEISEKCYREEQIARVTTTNSYGPHTVSFNPVTGHALFDSYVKSFSVRSFFTKCFKIPYRLILSAMRH